MSVAGEMMRPVGQPWLAPLHLWRELLVSMLMAGMSFALGLGLIRLGFHPSLLDVALIVKDKPLIAAYLFNGAFALLILDAGWSASLLGAKWRDLLVSPLHPRFWQFAFAWILIDLLFIGAFILISHTFDGYQNDESRPFELAPFIVVCLIGAPAFLLGWIRYRLVLWPIHVLATGRLLDLETAWRATAERNNALFDMSLGIGVLCVGVLVVGIAVFAVVTDFAALLAAALGVAILPLIFRLLQLAAFVDQYRRAGEGA
ncbi:hypothetical protein [Dongia rigui]|uniref:Uncharacterized protein n=1 Tax=Dongia rigui TaxID=940149 RepID=A0ABU5DXQ6_9PROT|nr:hypothetical protein [Dongia rigui]MDY0871700.1 hypothetical protein [Dongia rigui]